MSFVTVKGLPPPQTAEHRERVRTLARNSRIGGAIYDAVVAISAKLEGATLVTADSRAIPVYELVEVEYQPLTS